MLTVSTVAEDRGVHHVQTELENICLSPQSDLLSQMVQMQMQTVHRLHLSDQRLECHCVVIERSNRMSLAGV